MMANSYDSERLRALGDCLERQTDIQTDQSWSHFCEWKMTGTSTRIEKWEGYGVFCLGPFY